jgi:hypothetical protein
MVLGIIFVAIITFMPEGLVPGSIRLGKMGLRGLGKRTRPALTPSGEAGR